MCEGVFLVEPFHSWTGAVGPGGDASVGSICEYLGWFLNGILDWGRAWPGVGWCPVQATLQGTSARWMGCYAHSGSANASVPGLRSGSFAWQPSPHLLSWIGQYA